MKKALPVFILTLLLSAFFVVSTVNGVTVSSTINSDTTWTKQSSPYTISGTVTVTNGATLTIEPGVTVNIGQGASLQIEGTLTAKGTNTDNIQLNGGGDLVLMPSSPGWNQQTSSGSIIENAVINTLPVTVCNSAKIDNNTLYAFIYLNGGSPEISYNNIVGFINSNQSLQSPVISHNNIAGSIILRGGSPTVSQNVIKGIDTYEQKSDCSAIVLIAQYGPTTRLFNAVITDNTIVSGLDGISSLAEGGLIANNLIANCSRTGLALGTMPETTLYARVENNTITNCATGIDLFNYNSPSPPPPIITQNNFLNNGQYNVDSACGVNLTLTYNWWGTTDASAIQQTIHDHTFDPLVGVISYIPCLTAANPFAYPHDSNSFGNSGATIPPNGNTAAPTPPIQTSDNSTTAPTPTSNSTSFAIESNSTVSEVSFNATASEISFTVNGTAGTTGYVKATISKAFMPNGANIKVYVDGNPVNYTQTSNQEAWIITFIYHHSIHQVRINQEQNPARITLTEGKYLIFIAVGVVAVLLGFLGLIIWVTLGQKHSSKNKAFLPATEQPKQSRKNNCKINNQNPTNLCESM